MIVCTPIFRTRYQGVAAEALFMHSFDVTAIKDCSISADGTLATLTFVTRYVGDMGITLPVERLRELALRVAPAEPSPKSSEAETAAPPATKSNLMTVSLASNWLAAADKRRGVIVVVINPNTPKHTGFAIKHEAARKLATALVKQADAIGKTTPSAIGRTPSC